MHKIWYIEILSNINIKRQIASTWRCLSIFLVRTPVIHASDSHRCVGTLEAPTSYGNNRLCLRAVGARKLVEILIKGAILSVADCGSKYELHPRCSRSFILDENGKKVSLIALAQKINDSNCITIIEQVKQIVLFLIINDVPYNKQNTLIIKLKFISLNFVLLIKNL